MSIELNKESVEQADASSCQGTNCGTTTGDHSSECLAEAAAGQGWELKPGDLCGRDCPIHKISVEQAGGDERAAFERAFTVQEGIYFDGKRGEYRSMNLRAIEATDAQDLNLRLQGWQARAALAQPSPAQAEQAEAEAERPEVVARVDGADEDWFIQPEDETEMHNEGLLFAGCELGRMIDFDRIVGALRAENAKLSEALDRWPLIRDSLKLRLADALARVAELEGKLTDWVHEGFRLNEALAVAKAQHSVPDVCDGKEQNAFEDWASKEGMNMERHPLHWLFLDAKTYSARQGWKAALKYARNMLAAAPVCRLSRSALTEAQMRRLYENSTETENERLGFEAFARLIRRAEAVHQITAAPGKEGV